MKKKKETPMHPVVENIRKIIMDKGITQVAASELAATTDIPAISLPVISQSVTMIPLISYRL